jgi:hypothetical protein
MDGKGTKKFQGNPAIKELILRAKIHPPIVRNGSVLLYLSIDREMDVWDSEKR